MAKLIKIRESARARKLATAIFSERLRRDFTKARGTIAVVPLYSIDPAKLEPLDQAVRLGWRYMWIDENRAAGATVDIVRARSRPHQPISYSIGSFPVVLNRRLESLMGEMAAIDQSFRPRLLSLRPLQLEAVWLHADDAADHILALSGEFDGTRFFDEARKRAGALGAPRPPQERE